MNLLLTKYKDFGLNSRRFSEEDFFRICEEENILIKEISQPFSWWMCLDGMSCIVLYRKLRGYRLLFTMFHELAHHFEDAGEALNAVEPFGASNSKMEVRADFFAVIAIYPLEALHTGELLEDEKYDPFLKHIRLEREKINFLYGV